MIDSTNAKLFIPSLNNKFIVHELFNQYHITGSEGILQSEAIR